MVMSALDERLLFAGGLISRLRGRGGGHSGPNWMKGHVHPETRHYTHPVIHALLARQLTLPLGCRPENRQEPV